MPTVYDVESPPRNGGAKQSLHDYAGKVLLVVNVASACGFTPQYAALETLYETHRDRGFEILAFPSNDFGAQEPASDADIAIFCKSTFGVQFPLFEKISVKGPAQHPLYAFLTAERPEIDGAPDDLRAKLTGFGMQTDPPPAVLWNFEKFLIARDGSVVGRFASHVTPDDPMLVEAIERELARA